MNMLETLIMQQLSHLIRGKSTPEEHLAHTEALAVAQKIDPARCRGLIILSVQDSVEKGPKGEDGLELVCSMAGAENVLDALVEGAQGIITAQHLTRHHAAEVAAHPLLSALLAGSGVESDSVSERYSGAGKPQH